MVPAFGSFAGKHFFSSVLFYQIQEDEEEDKEKTKCVNKHNRIAQKKNPILLISLKVEQRPINLNIGYRLAGPQAHLPTLQYITSPLGGDS